jgi:hypothetical protein
MHATFWLGNLKGSSEDVSVHGRIILEWILWKELRGVNWMHLALNRDQYQDLVMSLPVP